MHDVDKIYFVYVREGKVHSFHLLRLLNSSILSLRRSGRIILSVVEAVVHHVYQHESLIELNYAVSEGGAFFQFSECNFIASIHEEHCSACSITYN